MKTKTEKILWCKACSKAYVSNKKKKCCGVDLEEIGVMESSVSTRDNSQADKAN